jgi:hypothetical protein
MSWKQYPKDKHGKLTKPDAYDSAVDGDLDIAYALLLAAVQWPHMVKYNYLDSGRKTLRAIIQYEIDTTDKKFLRGSSDPVGDGDHGDKFIRISDFMPVNIRAFAAASLKDSTFWNAFLQANYERFRAIQRTESKQYGLFPDYIYENKPGDFTVISDENSRLAKHQDLDDGGEGDNPHGAYYGFNACRVPWRVGLDYLLTGSNDAKQIIDSLNSGVQRYTEDSACMLSNILLLADYRSHATHHNYIDSLSSAKSADLNTIGPLCIAAMAGNNSAWRTRLFQLMTDQRTTMCGNADPTLLGIHDYYENTIRLICDIVITHNYWTPCAADFKKP